MQCSANKFRTKQYVNDVGCSLDERTVREGDLDKYLICFDPVEVVGNSEAEDNVSVMKQRSIGELYSVPAHTTEYLSIIFFARHNL